MLDWLHVAILSRTVQVVTTTDPKGIECLKMRSDDPFDYLECFSATLEFISKTTAKKFKQTNRTFNRKKDDAVSRKLRNEGNKIFHSKTEITRFEEESLELYSRSIAYAMPNGKELALGFAARSAVLLRLARPRECLQDIETALKTKFVKESIPELNIRRAQCFSMLARHSYIHAKFWLKHTPPNDPELKKFHKDLKGHSASDYEFTVDRPDPALPEIESPSPEFPCASDAIDVEYSGPRGRMVVATRDIKVGEVLVVEKPYLVHNHEGKYYCYCSHCMLQCFGGIPCNSCPNTIYCSEKCKESAWEEYHDFECPVLNMLLQHKSIITLHRYTLTCISAALKLLIVFYKEAGGLDELKERIKEFQKRSEGKVESEWYGSKSTLESILILESTICKTSIEDFQNTIMVAIQVLYSLAVASDFCRIQYERNCMSDKEIVFSLSQNEDALFVGGLLVRLLLLVRHNYVFASDIIFKRKDFGRKKSLLLIPNNYRGLSLPTFLITFTRSCYFNATLQWVGDHAVVHSLFPIRKDEEVILSSRSSWWMYMSKEDRLDLLAPWETECHCKACVENWPTEVHLESFEKTAKSPELRIMLQKALEPLTSLHEEICEKFIVKNYNVTLNSLKSMMEAIHEGANLPCKELFLACQAMTYFYYLTGVKSPIVSSKSFELKNRTPSLRYINR